MADANFTPFPTVQPTGAPSDYERVDASSASFGAAVGQAEEGAGAKIEGVGKEVFQTALNFAEMKNEVWANDQNTQYTKQMGEHYQKFSELQGRSALDGLDDYQNTINGIYKDAVASAPNLSSRKMLSNSMRYMSDRFLNYGMMHANQQFADWQRQSAQDASDEHANQAMLAATNNKPQDMDASLKAGMGQQVKFAEQHGLGPQESLALQHKWMGQTVSTIVKGILDQAEPDSIDIAKAIYNTYKSQMDSKGQVIAEAALKPAVEATTVSLKTQGAVAPTYGPAPAGFTDIERKHNNPAGYLTGTYAIESNSGRNLGSGKKYKGPFQFDDPTAKSVGLDDPMDLNKSAEATAVLAEKNAKILRPYLGRDPTAGELYIAHQQGVGGAVSLLTHPNETAASLIGADRVAANIPSSMKGQADKITAAQFVAYWAGHFGGETSGFVGRDAPSPASSVYAPESIAVERVMNDPELNANPRLQSKVLSAVHQTYSNWQIENKSDIEKLRSNVPSLISQIESGEGDIDSLVSQYPKDEVRNLLPDKAQRWEEEVDTAQKIGTLIQGYKWESNDAVVNAWQDLAGGHGPISEMIGKNSADPWEFSRLQASGTKRLEAVLRERQQRLLDSGTADPAGFVMANPAINAARKAVVPNDPASFENYVRKTVTLQQQMGVPEQFTHVLTRPEAEQWVQQITGNVGTARATMDGIQKHMGNAWGNVWSDLVTLGKLPMEYQGLQVLNNQNDLATYTKVLQETKKDGFQGWEMSLGLGDKTAGIQAKKELDIGVEAGIAPYVNALQQAGRSEAEINSVINSVEHLAYGNRYFNKDDNAVANAVGSFIGKYSYMYQGGAAVPTEVFDIVNHNAHTLVDQLTPKDIRLPDDIGRAGQPSVEAYMAQLKATPTWINSENGAKLYLRDMRGKKVLGNDGQPLAVILRGAQPFSSNFNHKSASPDDVAITAYRNSLTSQGHLNPEQIDTMTSDYAKQLQDYRTNKARGEHVR